MANDPVKNILGTVQKVGAPRVVDLQTIEIVAANLRRHYPEFTIEERIAIARRGIADSPGFVSEPEPGKQSSGTLGAFQDAVLRHGAVPKDIADLLRRKRDRNPSFNDSEVRV